MDFYSLPFYITSVSCISCKVVLSQTNDISNFNPVRAVICTANWVEHTSIQNSPFKLLSFTSENLDKAAAADFLGEIQSWQKNTQSEWKVWFLIWYDI